ncbi:MAG TPA: efflux RND transporter periplasmic adaptor subunit [Sedimentisphaerales bacterium]|nr:efflux RND transporter periplasmic adaptor subunit [Sedimentisphaerales bacterium]
MSKLTNPNQIGWVLSVFIILFGAILWLTGSLHFGPAPPAAHADNQHASHDGHGHEAAGEVCAEHGVPESQCTLCNPDSLHAPTARAGSEDDLSVLEKAMCEHQIRTVECDNCRFELGVVKIQASVADALVETSLVEDVERAHTLRLTGQVQLDQTRVVDVVAMGGGRVERVEKLLGDKLKQSDVLAVIHSDDLGQAKAGFLEVEAKLELARATFEREKELYEKKVSSEADYLGAMSELSAAEAYYAAAEKRLRLFGLETAQIADIRHERNTGQFARLILRAPQAGTIIAQNISAGKTVGTTETLYTLADLSNLWVWCDVYEKDLAVLHEQFSKGKPLKAVVRVKAFEAARFEGVIDLVGNLMDEHTRTVKVRVQVTNEDRRLRPGMFADVEVNVPLEGRMTAVPSTAVLSDDGRSFVFQHWKEDLWVRRDVVVGRKQGPFVEILSGVPKGARVVAGGAFMLKSDILREKMGAGCAD